MPDENRLGHPEFVSADTPLRSADIDGNKLILAFSQSVSAGETIRLDYNLNYDAVSFDFKSGNPDIAVTNLTQSSGGNTPGGSTTVPVTGITLDQSTLSLTTGGTGTCTITATCGSFSATCTVTVSAATTTPPPNTTVTIDLSGLGLENGVLALEIGEDVDLQIDATPGGVIFTATGLPGG